MESGENARFIISRFLLFTRENSFVGKLHFYEIPSPKPVDFFVIDSRKLHSLFPTLEKNSQKSILFYV